MPRLVYVDTVLPLEGEVVLGRHSQAGLRIDDEKASRRHARVFVEDGQWWVEDLDSANGTGLNGKPLKGRHRLVHDDCITIGKSRILFQDPDAAERAAGQIGSERRSHAAVGVVGNPSLLVGRTIGGFRLDAVLAKTPLGALYRARQLALERDVALKLFKPEVAAAGFAERLQAAARAVDAVRHPGLVRVHEVGTELELGAVWYAMELVDGETFAALVKRDGRVPAPQAVLLVERAGQALAAAHAAGVAHKDLSPANVMLARDGAVRVLELGFADALASGRGAAPVGDPAFTSPDGRRDERADIYALGCLLWFLIAGEPPFPGATPAAIAAAHRDQPVPSARALDPALPAKLDEVLLGMLAKQPEWRFGTLAEVLAEFRPLREALLAAPPAPAPAPRRADEAAAAAPEERAVRQRPSPWPRRGMNLCWLVLVAGGAWWFWRQSGLRHWFDRPADPVAQAPRPASPTPTLPPVADPGAGRHADPVPATPPIPTRPPATDLAEQWRTLRAAAERDAAEGSWGSAERQLREFALLPGLSDALRDDVRIAIARLQVDGSAWYQAEIAKLPTSGDVAGQALAALSRLRDVALASDRPDAEARHQTAQSRLLQRLEQARRDARRRLEAGRAAELPALAAALEAPFRETPIAGLQRQFALLATEAARTAPQWQGDWPRTRQALRAASGAEAALAAAAALILAGDVAGGQAVLANEGGLTGGPYLRRREALLGREVAVLRFADPGDLLFIENVLGEPTFGDGALTGAPGEMVGIACTIPVGGAAWEVQVTLEVRDAAGAADGAQVGLGAVVQGQPELAVRLDRDAMTIRVHAAAGWIEQRLDRPDTVPLRLRLACRDDALQVLVNGQAVMEVEQPRVPAGARLALDIAGAQWRLTELQVVGGGG